MYNEWLKTTPKGQALSEKKRIRESKSVSAASYAKQLEASIRKHEAALEDLRDRLALANAFAEEKRRQSKLREARVEVAFKEAAIRRELFPYNFSQSAEPPPQYLPEVLLSGETNKKITASDIFGSQP